MVEPRFVGTDAEANQERLVEDWMANHPWSTVPEIRAGVATESGWDIERIQGRLDRIKKRRHLDDRWREGGVKEYRLGPARAHRRKKAFGLEAKVFIGEDPSVMIQQSDIDDERVKDEVEALRAMVEEFVHTRIVPLLAGRVSETLEQRQEREFLELLAELAR